MIAALFGGALAGLGCYLLIQALLPSHPGFAVAVLRLDALRSIAMPETDPPLGWIRRLGTWQHSVGRWLANIGTASGWSLSRLRADVAILDRSWEGFLAAKVLYAVASLLVTPALFGLLALLGWNMAPMFPLWTTLVAAGVAFALPDIRVRRQAAIRRRNFRYVVGCYLDLVAMNLAAGRGMPEALVTTARIGDGWAFERIRDCLASAHLAGLTSWQALGRLGSELAVDELRDLSSALSLVAEDGATVRASLAARAAGMRHRELTETEGQAAERSQSMLIAQLLLCVGYLLFLVYPAAVRIFRL